MQQMMMKMRRRVETMMTRPMMMVTVPRSGSAPVSAEQQYL